MIETIRKMVGVTDSLEAEPGTIRGDLSLIRAKMWFMHRIVSNLQNENLKTFLELLYIKYCLIAVGGVCLILFFLRFFLGAPVLFESHWMDSPTTIDPALTDPKTLISSRLSTPTEAQKTAPVCVLVHGFSASSFEWQEFLSHANQWDDTVLFSTIVMGGHGRNFDSFKSASYQDWFAPITEEVQRLQSLG